MFQDHTTERLQLRLLDSQYHAEVLSFYQRNQSYFDKWEPAKTPNFYTMSYQYHALAYEYEEIHKLKALRYWLFLKEDPRTIIGSVSFTNILRGCYQSCQIGYRLDQAYTGQGYALEACKNAIGITFRIYNLHRVNAYIMPSNEPSIKLIKKLGFIYEGISYQSILIQNRWEDHATFALINRDSSVIA